MQCPAPTSRRKRSLNVDSSAFGYFISVSNDGNNFTKELAVIIYDSMCFECSTTNLTCLELVRRLLLKMKFTLSIIELCH